MDCVIDDFNIIIKLFNNLKESIIFYISEIKKLYSETVTGGNIESSINKFKNILSTFINSFIYFCNYKLSDNTNVIYFLLNMYVDTIRIKDIQYSKQGLICRYFIPSIILNSDNDTFYTNIKLNIYNEVTGGVDICSYDLIDPYDLTNNNMEYLLNYYSEIITGDNIQLIKKIDIIIKNACLSRRHIILLYKLELI